MWIVCSVACSVGSMLALLDQPAAQLVDDRRLLDPDRADLDAGVALHAGPRGLGADGVAADHREREAVGRPARRVQERARARRRRPATPPRVGLLAQLEDHVARRQRPAGRVRRAGLVAAPALRAGVELDQVARAEVGERAVARGSLRALGRDRRAGACRRAGRAARARRSSRACAPPSCTGCSRRRRSRAGRGTTTARGGSPRARRGEADADVDLRRHPAAELGAAVAGMVHRDAHALEQEAGQRDHEQDPDEGPVAAAVAAAVELRLARRAIGPRVVELARAGDRAPRHHHEQPDDQRGPEHVEHLLVGEVEGPVEVVPAEHRVGEVGVEAEDHRAREQRQEAVEDRRVRPARRSRSRRAIVRCASSARRPPQQRAARARAPAAAARRARGGTSRSGRATP